MKIRWGLWVIAVDLVLLLVLAVIYPDLMVSSGPVLSAHSALQRDCFACHAPFLGASSERCATCHKTAEIGLRTTRGVPLSARGLKASFHQQLSEANCMACHTDHKGDAAVARKGLTFSHALLRTDARERCASCHTRPDDTLHAKLGDGCQQCHSTQAWKPSSFDHAKLFVLDRDHEAPCATCHVGNNYKRYTCYGCHEHTPAKTLAQHAEEGVRNIDNCVACHRSADGEAAEGASRGGGESDD